MAANHDRNHSILQEEHWLTMREHKTAHRKQKAPHWIVITIRGRLLAYIAGYPVGAESEASPARRTSIHILNISFQLMLTVVLHRHFLSLGITHSVAQSSW